MKTRRQYPRGQEKYSFFYPIKKGFIHSLRAEMSMAKNSVITTALIKVAVLEEILVTPILARTATNPAKNAEPKA